MKQLIFAFAVASFSLGYAQQTPKKACCASKKECKKEDKKDCKNHKVCASHKTCK